MVRLGSTAIPSPATSSPDELVRVAQVMPESRGECGLIITGIGTTAHWESVEKPFAVGLVSLDGRTSRRSRGLDPQKYAGKIPVPLLWGHKQPIGEVFSIRASALAAHFQAVIYSPGTTGYDSDLLKRVWGAIRSGAVRALSVCLNGYPDDDGRWELSELSVCERGRNRFALIYRASFPDGHVVAHPLPTFTEADTWQAERAAKPSPETTDIDELVEAAVERAIDARMETRAAALSPDEIRDTIKREVTDAVTRAVATERQSLLADMPVPVTVVEARSSTPIDVRAVIKSEVAAWCARMHRGVWEVTEWYEQGQMVTFGGSTWSCQKACSGCRPGDSANWRLIVKRGADGRKR